MFDYPRDLSSIEILKNRNKHLGEAFSGIDKAREILNDLELTAGRLQEGKIEDPAKIALKTSALRDEVNRILAGLIECNLACVRNIPAWEQNQETP